MGKMILTIAAILLLSGCHGNVFKVDAKFTAEEEAKLQRAADAWADVGGDRLELVFGQKVDARDKGNIIVRTSARVAAMADDMFREHGYVAGTRISPIDGTQIWFTSDWSVGEWFYSDALHEFGHVQLHGGNEVHVDDENAVMFYASTAAEISAADRRALRLSREP